MKQTEITGEVERLFSLLGAYTSDSFGQIEIIRTKRARINTIIPFNKNDRNLIWEPDDFKPLFQVEHKMDNLFEDPLCFSIGRKEVWISTWYFGTGKPKKDVLCHPFVLSWTKFLEVNTIPQTVGLDGNCYPESFSLEKGLQILELWIKWVLKYS